MNYARIRAVLTPLARYARAVDHFGKSDSHLICRAVVLEEPIPGPSAGDCRAARRLLDSLPKTDGAAGSELVAAVQAFYDDWKAANGSLPSGPTRDGRLIAALLESGLFPSRREIEQEERDACEAVVLTVRYGEPRSWPGLNPTDWALGRTCTPQDAHMHDQGCTDAIKAIRARGDACRKD